MAVWALSDPHLSLSAPDKGMEVFGPQWKEHMPRIARNWQRVVLDSDVVLMPGDVSWSASLPQAAPDLKWLDSLPGTKVLVQGNHDHWWGPIGKTRAAMPRTVRLIQNDALRLGRFVFFGTRLWDSPDFSTADAVDWNTPDKKPPEKYLLKPPGHPETEARREIWNRELERLRLSIAAIPKEPGLRKIALLHYPPTTCDLRDTDATALLESVEGLTDVVFGHIHSLRRDVPKAFGTREGPHGPVNYRLCSADWLEMAPVRIV